MIVGHSVFTPFHNQVNQQREKIARVAVRWIFSRRILLVSESRGNHAGDAYEARDLILEKPSKPLLVQDLNFQLPQ